MSLVINCPFSHIIILYQFISYIVQTYPHQSPCFFCWMLPSCACLAVPLPAEQQQCCSQASCGPSRDGPWQSSNRTDPTCETAWNRRCKSHMPIPSWKTCSQRPSPSLFQSNENLMYILLYTTDAFPLTGHHLVTSSSSLLANHAAQVFVRARPKSLRCKDHSTSCKGLCKNLQLLRSKLGIKMRGIEWDWSPCTTGIV